jgi:hypothetical protein
MRFGSRIVAVAGAVTAAGALTFAGLTTASAGTARHHGVISGIEHFQLMTTSATSNKEKIIALGKVFTAGGIDHEGSKVDRVVFPGGTFKIRHSRGKGKQQFNPRTCLAVIQLHGTYKLFRGTGNFAGLRGHGKYQLSIVFVAARNSRGRCSEKKAPVAYQQVIKAHGPVSLP